jgi:hypothetical protein
MSANFAEGRFWKVSASVSSGSEGSDEYDCVTLVRDQQRPTHCNVLGEGLMPESISHFFIRRPPEIRQIETGPVPDHPAFRAGMKEIARHERISNSSSLACSFKSRNTTVDRFSLIYVCASLNL